MRIAPFAMLPKGAWTILKELARHALHHPVVGVLAAARTSQGSWLLVRRADTGTWAMPGGTLEWGETIVPALTREVEEETGAKVVDVGRLVGVYARPDRDPRFHAVTIVLQVIVDASTIGAENPLEIRDVKLFDDDEIPFPLAMQMDDILEDARRVGAPPVVE